MITLDEFRSIDNEVKTAVVQLLDFVKEKCRDHNYILLLADGEFKPDLIGSHLNLNPYVIDYYMDIKHDSDRMEFWTEFLRQNYAFPNGATQVEDNNFRLHLELMIYTHMWESTTFLKRLFRLALLAHEDDYAWDVTVPEMQKHLFIRNQIRDKLQGKGLMLANVISKGFHTSLRNAFAHSQYSFNEYQHCIDLHTYKGDPTWDIKLITYNDWSKRFAYSIFLNYHLQNHIHMRRISLVEDFGKDQFLIIHPINPRKFIVRKLYYDIERDGFSFYQF
jgi:hypothetical protein